MHKMDKNLPFFCGNNTGDPLHNLTELHTTYQHTTKLHTALWLAGVLARLCASPVWVTFFTT